MGNKNCCAQEKDVSKEMNLDNGFNPKPMGGYIDQPMSNMESPSKSTARDLQEYYNHD
jgi:hypothetical protein